MEDSWTLRFSDSCSDDSNKGNDLIININYRERHVHDVQKLYVSSCPIARGK